MKFYNYFSDKNELSSYLEGNFSGKGIYFNPDEFQKKETLRSKLELSSKNGEMIFHLKSKKNESLNFKTDIGEISEIKEDICEFFSNKNLLVQIQAMTEDRMHIHISCKKNGMNIIYISGILNRNKFFRLFSFFKNY